MLRRDHWYMRSLYETEGREALADYLTLPFFDLAEVLVDALPDVTGQDPKGMFAHRPFDRFVLYNAGGYGLTIIDRQPVVTIEGLPRTFPEGYLLTFVLPNGQPLMLMFDDATGELRLNKDTSALLAGVTARPDASDLSPEELLKFYFRLTAQEIQFILSSERYVVEEVTEAGRKVPSKKPWTRHDLPRHIMLSPQEAKKYGHRTDRGGTHASPAPHQRRGHWRQLVSGRFIEKRRVWVRPAWVGDTEWTLKVK